MTDHPLARLRALLRPFDGQSRRHHALVAAGGLLVWSAAFLAALALLGGEAVATAQTAAAVEGRRLAGVAAGVGSGAYFGLAFARERGGPVSNLLLAPLSAAVGATGVPIAVVYGGAPDAVFAAAFGTVAAEVGTALVLAAATVPAVVVAAVHLAVVATPEQRRRVERRFAELPGVHLGPRPIEDWRRADGGEEVAGDGGPGER